MTTAFRAQGMCSSRSLPLLPGPLWVVVYVMVPSKGQIRAAWKLLVSDKNTLNHTTVCKQIILLFWKFFLHWRLLMVSHGNLSNSKSPGLFFFFSFLADLKNSVVWMGSTCTLIFKSSKLTKKKKKENLQNFDFAVPAGHRVKLKESEKKDNSVSSLFFFFFCCCCWLL